MTRTPAPINMTAISITYNPALAVSPVFTVSFFVFSAFAASVYAVETFSFTTFGASSAVFACSAIT